MNKNILVVSPHPDDESLGCAGTLLRHAADGDQIHWLNITDIHQEHGFSKEQIQKRSQEIEEVKKRYSFTSFNNLSFPTTKLETIPIGEIISSIGKVFSIVTPDTLYIPFKGDIHTDHKIAFESVASCTKWFRYPSIRRILVYETISETDFSVDLHVPGFCPNVFVNIDDYFEQKLEILKIYASEMGIFPFPRSETAVRALATLRGAASGFEVAEAFMLLKEMY
jgi:N-acetylglucosamine malate deacetylase 1